MESGPVRVLIIEDSLPDARLIEIMLTGVAGSHPFEVKRAERLGRAIEMMREAPFDVVLTDLTLPDSYGLETVKGVKSGAGGAPIIVLTGLQDEAMAARALREGAQDYLVKGQVDTPMLTRAIRYAIERTVSRRERGVKQGRPQGGSVDEAGRDEAGHIEIVGESPAIMEVKETINTVARTSNTSVLIQGETGTGKGLVANAIHYLSNRRANLLMKLNCSAIPDTLLETEMFGYEKGAFTDAKSAKKGLFELADGGTVFLDEIGDMDIRLQPKLLQVLENRSFRKVGGLTDIKVDVRVIAATNKDLAGMVREKRFREDLYYRLKVMVIEIPPLRERKEDILIIAGHFIREESARTDRPGKGPLRLSEGAKEALLNYNWPGNIRELKNVIERAVILSDSEEIGKEHLPHEMLRGQAPKSPPLLSTLPVSASLEEMERNHIINVLKSVDGNKTRASKILGISRLTLREKIKRYNIEENSLEPPS